MSSNLETYFVVAYDHVDGKFYVDDETAAAYFDHDTWDEDTGEWMYLDEATDVAENMSELQQKLREALKFREIFDKGEDK